MNNGKIVLGSILFLMLLAPAAHAESRVGCLLRFLGRIAAVGERQCVAQEVRMGVSQGLRTGVYQELMMGRKATGMLQESGAGVVQDFRMGKELRTGVLHESGAGVAQKFRLAGRAAGVGGSATCITIAGRKYYVVTQPDGSVKQVSASSIDFEPEASSVDRGPDEGEKLGGFLVVGGLGAAGLVLMGLVAAGFKTEYPKPSA